MNKYYHRGNGEVVVLNNEDPSRAFYEEPTHYCDPQVPIGFLDGYVERYERWDIGKEEWVGIVGASEFKLLTGLGIDETRISLVKADEGEPLVKGETKNSNNMKSGIELIAEERERQIALGYDSEHDETESAFQLSGAAAMYIAEAINKDFKDHTHYDNMGSCARFQVREIDTRKWSEQWPWSDRNGLVKSDIKTCLITAGALIAAEIDRLQNT